MTVPLHQRPLTALALASPDGGFVPVETILGLCQGFTEDGLVTYLMRARRAELVRTRTWTLLPGYWHREVALP